MNFNEYLGGCTAHWADAHTVKSLFTDRFDGCQCHKAFPDQLHTFVGDCSSENLFVAMVPDGDVRFPTNKWKDDSIVAVVGNRVSADYLEYLQDMEISYICGGDDGENMDSVMKRLQKDFGVNRLLIHT
jgi:5-amino-6-(5-phosphoribosylamino)uracil reductase